MKEGKMTNYRVGQDEKRKGKLKKEMNKGEMTNNREKQNIKREIERKLRRYKRRERWQTTRKERKKV